MRFLVAVSVIWVCAGVATPQDFFSGISGRSIVFLGQTITVDPHQDGHRLNFDSNNSSFSRNHSSNSLNSLFSSLFSSQFNQLHRSSDLSLPLHLCPNQ